MSVVRLCGLILLVSIERNMCDFVGIGGLIEVFKLCWMDGLNVLRVVWFFFFIL